MLKKCHTFVVAFALLAQSAFACDMPDPISLPDGSTATEAEMNEAGAAFSNYLSGMQSYLACLKAEYDWKRTTAGKESKQKIKARENEYAQLHNEATDEMINWSDSFNQTVEVYRNRE